jgi:Spy/CpxP family protein refolding chaperone
MRQFTIAAATVAIAALISAAPASAERDHGPLKQNGQCWQKQKGQEAGTWGYWAACPQPASAPAVQKPARRRT